MLARCGGLTGNKSALKLDSETFTVMISESSIDPKMIKFEGDSKARFPGNTSSWTIWERGAEYFSGEIWFQIPLHKTQVVFQLLHDGLEN